MLVGREQEVVVGVVVLDRTPAGDHAPPQPVPTRSARRIGEIESERRYRSPAVVGAGVGTGDDDQPVVRVDGAVHRGILAASRTPAQRLERDNFAVQYGDAVGVLAFFVPVPTAVETRLCEHRQVSDRPVGFLASAVILTARTEQADTAKQCDEHVSRIEIHP